MTPTIIPRIQAKLTKDEFNNSYKIYQQLKGLLQPMGETQFMRLTQKYYTLPYQNYGNISEFIDYIKLLEEQINATKVMMTPYKRIFLCLMMALWEVEHFQSLVQI